MENQAKFEGWAVVEIMGHQRHAGYCRTQAFGSAVLLEITSPEIPAFERVLDRSEWIDGRYEAKGCRVESKRMHQHVLVGMDSIYRITPCTEAEALGTLPLESVVTFRPERLQLAEANDCSVELAEEEDPDQPF